MIRQLLHIALYVGLILHCSTSSAYAQTTELVTARNIPSFTLLRAGDSGSAVCRAKGAERILGRLTLAGEPSLISIGAMFSPLVPSVSDQEARLRKQMNASIRALKRPSGSKARKQARKRLLKAKAALTELSSYVNACNSFVPASQNDDSSDAPPAETPSANTPIAETPPTDGDPQDDEQKVFVDDAGEGPTHTCSPRSVRGSVTGGEATIVTLANDSFVESQNATSGSFSFPNVPAGTYTLFAESEGASFGPAHTVIVRNGEDCAAISLVRQELPQSDDFAFRWRQQASLTSGLEQQTKVDHQRTAAAATSVASLSTQSAPSSRSSAAAELLGKFKITLDSRELSWSAEHAERLRLALYTILPESNSDAPVRTNSVWVLTAEYLPNDIQIKEVGDTLEVRITSEAFRYGALTPATLDGVRGQFFSERLTIAAARFLTLDGRDRAMIEQIFSSRYNIQVVDDLEYAAALTGRTTQESAASFQQFSSNELLLILAGIAQLPSLSETRALQLSIIRRKNGVRHPSNIHDEAKITSYSGADLGYPYIEFSREAFLPPSGKALADIELPNKEILLTGIVGAYASVIWDRVLTQELQDAWIAETGWSSEAASNEFVNDNPTEVGRMLPVGVTENGPKGDFATSVALYIVSPEELRFRSSRRFEFLKLYVMHGLRYSRQFREDLKFPVLNLRPDFSYPGKVIAAEAIVSGSPTEDKKVRLILTLEGSDPLEHGATYASITLVHQVTKSKITLGANARRPDPRYAASLVLEGENQISKYAKSGYYTIAFMSLTDAVGNVRYENRPTIGLTVFLNNTLTVPAPAELEPGSVTLKLSEMLIQGVTVPQITTEFRVTNPNALTGASDQVGGATGASRGFLRSDTIVRKIGDTVRISRPVSPFLPSDLYGVYLIALRSRGSSAEYRFSLYSESNQLAMPLLEYENSNSDVTPPELDLNQISVQASPLYPDKPNGATRVVMKVRAKDDLSGLNSIYFCMRSPLDRSNCGSFNLKLKTTVLPDGTTEFKEYESTLSLPPGSAPGTWGVDYISLEDRVGNSVLHSLSEIVKFVVTNKDSN